MAQYELDRSLALETWKRLDPFTQGYVEVAFWLLADADGCSLDYLGLHDLPASTLESMITACRAFQETAAGLLDGCDLSQAGHDFYLTRNRHGAGFWDRDPACYPADPTGRQLTAIAHSFGEWDLAVDDDGNILEE